MTMIVPISRNELTIRRLERRQAQLDVSGAQTSGGGKFNSKQNNTQLPAVTVQPDERPSTELVARPEKPQIDTQFAAQIIGQYTIQDDDLSDPQEINAAYQNWTYARRARPYPKPKSLVA